MEFYSEEIIKIIEGGKDYPIKYITPTEKINGTRFIYFCIS